MSPSHGGPVSLARDPEHAWRRFPLLWALALGAYLTFTILLLLSSAADRQAGLLFTPNCAVLAGGVIVATIDFRRSPMLGVVAAAVQAVIMTIMLGMWWSGPGSLGPVLIINSAIAAGFLLLAAFYQCVVGRGRYRWPGV